MILYLLVPLFLIWLAIPILAPGIGSDLLYRTQRIVRRTKEKRISLRSLLVTYLENLMQGPFLRKLDGILLMAGKPGNLKAVEVLLLQFVMLIGVLVLGMWAKKTPTSTLVIFGFLFCSLPWQNWLKRIKRRRLEAAEQMRFLKPRFATYLRRGIPYEQALRDIANSAYGQFGEAFRARLQESRTRPLTESLLDLQREFRCRELVRFVQAIKVAEQKTSHALLKQIDKQIRDDAARVDEFTQQQKAATEIKIRGYALLAFVYVMLFVGYFTYYLVRDFLHQGHFFGF